jgi:hypothetical protein
MRAKACHGPSAGECGCCGNTGGEPAAGEILTHHANQCEFATMDDLGAGAIDEEPIGTIYCDARREALPPPCQTFEGFGITIRAVCFDVYCLMMRDEGASMGHIHAGTHSGTPGA